MFIFWFAASKQRNKEFNHTAFRQRWKVPTFFIPLLQRAEYWNPVVNSYSEPPFYMNFLAQTLLSNTIPVPNLVNNLLLTAELLHTSNFISFQHKLINCKIMVTFLLFSKNYLNEEYYMLIISYLVFSCCGSY